MTWIKKAINAQKNANSTSGRLIKDWVLTNAAEVRAPLLKMKFIAVSHVIRSCDSYLARRTRDCAMFMLYITSL